MRFTDDEWMLMMLYSLITGLDAAQQGSHFQLSLTLNRGPCSQTRNHF